ncbi:MAG: hypothetical protein AAF628_05335 [Planctomycetota bacterium]
MTPFRLVCLAVAAVVLYGGLATIHLQEQGLNGDELHQAYGAFAYVGQPTQINAHCHVFGLPLLNMPYSGAIKTAMYGAYLWAFDAQFEVVSWRLLGILLAGLALGGFMLLAGRPLGTAGILTVLALWLSDTTLLVGTRHDWGPMALALLLRALLIALWLRGLRPGPLAARSSFGLGAITGFALFEKVSNVALLMPLLLFFAADRRRRSRPHLVAGIGGLALGSLPLTVVNAHSWLIHGEPVSLTKADAQAARTDLWAFIADYLSLGGGSQARESVFGATAWAGADDIEGIATLLLLGLVLLAASCLRPDPKLRGAAVLATAYTAIAGVLFALPAETKLHHWAIGTPFQYVAAGLALTACRQSARRRGRAIGGAILALLVLLCGARAPGLLDYWEAVDQGRHSHMYSPDITALATFAAQQPSTTVFLASDWGATAAIYCLAQGRPQHVVDFYWWYAEPRHFDIVLDGKATFYLYRLAQPAAILPQVTQQMERDALALSGWRRVAPEPDLQPLADLSVQKFIRN